MKVLSKLKLNVLSKEELKEREMNNLFGGGESGNCRCGCPSNNTSGNGRSNTEDGYTITDGWGDGNDVCSCNSNESFANYSTPSGKECTCTSITLGFNNVKS